MPDISGRTIQVYQVDVFTSTPLSGNPAGVVLDADTLDDTDMQAVARELNNSETAFVLLPDGDDHQLRVRFFTPTTEVPSCGHATLGAHYVRASQLGLPASTVVQKTGAGIGQVRIEPHDGDYRVAMVQHPVVIEDSLPQGQRDAILSGLGVTEDELDPRCPVQQVSTGHSKILIGLKSLDILHRLNPDMAALVRVSSLTGCNGYFVFVITGDDGFLAHGRMFAPAIGINEDPVTGNGNGPLGVYLAHHRLGNPQGEELAFRAIQGEAMGRPGVVDVVVHLRDSEPNAVTISGEAVIVFETEMKI